MAALLTAQDAWGGDMPDWVHALATACESSSQNKVARKLGYSAPLVSQVLRRKYTGDMKAVEDVVRGVFMAGVVDCPAVGRLALNECRNWRRKAPKPTHGNALDNRMSRACRKCPIYLQQEDAPHASDT